MKLDIKLLGYIKFFENKTRAKVKDAFIDDNGAVVFIVKEGEIGKAIGKGGSTIRKLGFSMKKKLRVIEYSDDVEKFVRNIILPVEADKIEIVEKEVVIKPKSAQDKAILLGRNKSKLNEINKILKRYFEYTLKIA